MHPRLGSGAHPAARKPGRCRPGVLLRGPRELCAALLWTSLLLVPAYAGGAGTVPQLTALRASQRGADDTEYIELAGSPGQSLDGYSLLVVEGDHGRAGRIDRRIDFGGRDRFGPDGHFLLGVCAGLGRRYGVQPDLALPPDYLENSSLTVALVRTGSLAAHGLEGAAAVSALALDDGDAGDRFYFGAPRVGPDRKYFPPGARRSDGHWRMLDFNADAAPAPRAGGRPGCRTLVRAIPAVQGIAARSPLAGVEVRIRGIVTAVDRRRGGFWLQALRGDDDPRTSDAIFVHEPPGRGLKPAAGNLLRLSGRVQESRTGRHTPPRTELILVRDVRRQHRHLSLPPPVELDRLPHDSLERAARRWESLEGMRVRVRHALVIGPTNRYGDVIVLAPGNVRSDAALDRHRGILRLSSPGAGVVDYHPERIPVSPLGGRHMPALRSGDRLDRATGIVDVRHGTYRILVEHVESSPHPLPPVPGVPPATPDTLSVVALNVDNLFPPGAHTAAGQPPVRRRDYVVHRDKLVSLLLGRLRRPDLVVLAEIGRPSALQDLARRLSHVSGLPYRAGSRPSGDARGIRSGFLWRSDRLHLEHLLSLPAPGRNPLTGRFAIGARHLTVVAVHFRSKYADDPLFCACAPSRPSEIPRRRQAARVRAYVARSLWHSPRRLLLVAGDFNDFAFREPREGGPDPVTLVRGVRAPRLLDLTARIPPADRYSYIYRGNAQLIDHVLASRALGKRLAQIRLLHVNAALPAVLSRRPGIVWRSSDHDPIVVRFRLPNVF